MASAEQLLIQTLRSIEDEENWHLCFPDLYLSDPKVTNIKKLYETTSNDRKHLLRAAWNECIKEKAESATAEFKAVIPRTMKPIPEVEPVYKLFISIALMAVGFYLVGWIGVGIGIVVLLLLLIHHNIWEIEYGRQKYEKSLAETKISRTHTYILGWQLSTNGFFFYEEAPWAYPMDHPLNVSEYLS